MDRREHFLGKYNRLKKHRHNVGSFIVQLKSDQAVPLLIDAGFRVGKPYGFKGYRKVFFKGNEQQALEILSTIEGVEKAELEFLPVQEDSFIPNDIHTGMQLDYLRMMDVDGMWDEYSALVSSTARQLVGVADDRFDTEHEDISFVLPGLNLTDGTDHVDLRPDRMTSYHGTCCAGVIGANTNNNIGVFGLGLNCDVLPMAFSRFTEDSTLEPDYITASILYSLENKCRVLSWSFSLDVSEEPEWVADACQYAKDNNLIICVASGNQSLATVRWPARFETVFGISGLAANEGIGTNQIHLSANYGPGVDFCGPYEGYSTGPLNTYRSFGGTSNATPVVASCVANILTVNPRLTFDEVKAIMIRSCIPATRQAGDPRGQGIFGFGIPQFKKAIQLAAETLPPRGLYVPSGHIKGIYKGNAQGVPEPWLDKIYWIDESGNSHQFWEALM